MASNILLDEKFSSFAFELLSLPDLPSPRVYCSIVTDENLLFVMGGCDSTGNSKNNLFVYSHRENTWAEWPEMIRNRSGSSALYADNNIFLIGGVDENQLAVIEIDCLNIGSKTWNQVGTLPVAVVGCGVSLYKNKIFVVGGATTNNISQSFFGYFDLENYVWVDLEDLPTPRYAVTTYIYDDSLYVIGGRDILKAMVEIEVFHLVDLYWKKLSAIPSRRNYASTLGYDHYIYHIGGVSEGVGTWKPNVRKLVERYDILKDNWSKLKPLKLRRTDFSACIFKDNIIVAGGVSEQNEQMVPISDVENYNISNDKWSSVTNLSLPRCSMGYCTFLCGLIIIGGMGPGGPQRKVELIKFSKQC